MIFFEKMHLTAHTSDLMHLFPPKLHHLIKEYHLAISQKDYQLIEIKRILERDNV
tara:strand:+ start:2030 stop:2194 length:165 start_codon:yes stop_codon:yes gene_type:complete